MPRNAQGHYCETRMAWPSFVMKLQFLLDRYDRLRLARIAIDDHKRTMSEDSKARVWAAFEGKDLVLTAREQEALLDLREHDVLNDLVQADLEALWSDYSDMRRGGTDTVDFVAVETLWEAGGGNREWDRLNAQRKAALGLLAATPRPAPH